MDRIVILGAGESVEAYNPLPGDLIIAPNFLYLKFPVHIVCVTDLDAVPLIPPPNTHVYIAHSTFDDLMDPHDYKRFPIITGNGNNEIMRMSNFWEREIDLGFHGIDVNNTVPNMCFPIAYHYGLLNNVKDIAIYGVDCGGGYISGYKNSITELVSPNRLYVNKDISIRGLVAKGFTVNDYSKRRNLIVPPEISTEEMCDDDYGFINITYNSNE